MKGRKILSFLAVVLVSLSAVAQENMVPLMRELPQRAAFNPAMRHDGRGYFSAFFMLGGFSMGVSNSGFRYTDMFSRSSDDSLHFDLDKLAANIREINLATLDVGLPLLELGLPCGPFEGYLTVGAGVKMRADATFHKNLLDFRKGNYDFEEDAIRQCRVTDLFLRGEVYEEFYGGYSRMIGERVRVGARIKLLAGLMSVYADNMSLELETETDEAGRSSLKLTNRGHLQVSAPLEVSRDDDGYVDGLSLKDDLRLKDFNVFKNRGLAFDVGAEVTFADSMRIGLAVTDMGYIRWRNNPNQFDVKNSRRFYGVDVSDEVRAVQKGESLDEEGNSYWDNLRDSVESMGHMVADTSDFKTSMSARLLLTGEFPVRRWLTIGATFSGEFVNRRYYTHTSVAGIFRAPKVLSSIVSFSLNPGVRPSLGAGVVLRGGPFQYYLLAERIPLKMSTATGVHLRTGVNFVLGHRE